MEMETETETQPTAEALATAVLPEAVKNVIIGRTGGRLSDVVLVTQKTLTELDTRFVLDPKAALRIDLAPHQMHSPPFPVTKDEMRPLDRGARMKVGLIEPCLQISTTFLGKGRDLYYLSRNWVFVLQRNSNLLREGTLINLWSFRSSSGLLCFAIFPVELDQNHPN